MGHRGVGGVNQDITGQDITGKGIAELDGTGPGSAASASTPQTDIQRVMAIRDKERWLSSLIARRSRGGVLVYPIVLLTIGWAAGLNKESPWAFAMLLATVTALAGFRFALLIRFDRWYDKAPKPWRWSYGGAVLGSVACLSAVSSWSVWLHGAAGGGTLAFLLAAIVLSLMPMVYAAWLPFLWVAMALIAVPPCLTLLAHGDALTPWLLASAVFCGVALVRLGLVINREISRSRENVILLAERAEALETAHNELEAVSGELELRVERRTRELEARERDYRMIFEQAHDAIVIFDPRNEEVANVNQRACELYGYGRDEFIGMSLETISTDIETGRRHVRQTLKQQSFIQFETVQRRKDGEHIAVEINASSVEYRGRPAILSINRDVTERQRATELALAKELAERANEAKGRFLANMSHEIRTPMNGIIGISDMLRDLKMPPEVAEQVDLIHESSYGLLRVLDDILDVSRIEAGMLTIETKAFDLPKSVRRLVKLLQPRAESRGLTLALALDPEVPQWVIGDWPRLRQILTNLVENGLKFTDDGGVEVRIDGAGGIGNRPLRFQVQDSGVGIPHDAQGQIFDPFHQVDDSSSRSAGGAGLGLAISRQLVDLMGGHMALESQPGEGSTFTFTVPLQQSGSPSDDRELTGFSTDDIPVVPRGLRILVAEDNRVNQVVTLSMLKSLDFTATLAEDGEQAVEHVAASADEPFDLVLMDCQMPRVDGYEATRRIRHLAGDLGRVPIIALTAHAMEGDRERSLAAGMDDHLAKPFDRVELLSTIVRCRARIAAAAAKP